ncbi:hypothetical protein [Gordoniibacillus kamchatkensis]|uniref:hypothetical protein n=1 Tax=Gordoniibacillus kamchatkensis TaxID=1590651 RepID=UPI000B307F64|nr:hypothetical protein [Paenibacillus sp. VKM B-2647]
MNQNFYKELQQMSRNDEMRAQMLIKGLREILKEKKEENLISKMKRNKPKTNPNWN